MNDTLKTILERRSIRAYKDEQIKDSELDTILEAGKFAPTGMGRQPWHFSVVQNKEIMQKINNICRKTMLDSGVEMLIQRAKDEKFDILYKAPSLIVVSGDDSSPISQYDCTLAMENMFLAAASIGIGSCWIYAVTKDVLSSKEGAALKKELGIPKGYTPYASAVFGYKAAEPQPRAPRKEGTVSIIR